MEIQPRLEGATRRSVLAAAAGAAIAWLSQAIARPRVARATDGDALTIGTFSTTGNTVETRIATSASKAIVGESTASAGWGLFGVGPGTGVMGWSYAGSGVTGRCEPVLIALSGPVPKTGVFGVAHQDTTSKGVLGRSTAGVGVQGEAVEDFNHPGIWGAGVVGLSGPGSPPVPVKTGMYGYAGHDATSRGAFGRSPAGHGVHGQTATGIGVYATATTGTALWAEGRVHFKTSGLAIIAAGTRSKIVNPGLDLTATSKILSTLQGDPGGSTVIQRVAVNATADTFTIFLTANSVRAVNVSWFVMS